MSYWVDIIDTQDPSVIIQFEKAKESSIVLEWNGSDAKDDLVIVGSSLKFSMLSPTDVDAAFKDLFTGNESRYKVEIKKSIDNTVIWTGFLLPDLYSEPYKNVNFFVDFTAVDGLGRLKGKYLPVDYYRDEKSLIDIFCKILSLTGLELDLFFAPAIENSLNKNWNTIYIDTATFLDDKKKLDAYSILETLLQDTLCVCFQCDNRWYIEGVNRRNLRKNIFKKYNYLGEYQEEVEVLKLLKSPTSLQYPSITQVPQYNTITVSHKREPQNFPETIANEKNDGWSVFSGVIGEIYATDWNGNNGFYSKSVDPDYFNSLLKEYYTPDPIANPIVTPYDETKFINLKTKIYVFKYQKLRLTGEFSIIKWQTGLSLVDPFTMYNPLLYEVNLNGNVLFSNNRPVFPQEETLFFENGTSKFDFEFITQSEGLIDIKFWRPFGGMYESNILGFEIRELKLEVVGFEDEMVVTDEISDDFTVDKEIELTFSDDSSGFSNAFRLVKLKEATVTYNTIDIPVLYRFQQNGKHYSVVNLDGANLIKDNINTVYHNGSIISILDVVYNYSAGEQMVVVTDFLTTHNFQVRVYKTDDVISGREYWQQWTDSIYKIETERYAKVVANIIRRMFVSITEKIDLVSFSAFKFNDLLRFTYVLPNNYVITNCSWDLDKNKTTLTVGKAIYKDSGDTGGNPDNIPPIVNAGPDIELSNSQNTTSFTAIAYDTDGFIASQQWTKISGDSGDVIVTPNQLVTNVSGLTGDAYEYKIQVWDNDGASASDTLILYRRKSYEIGLNLTYITPGTSSPYVVPPHFKFNCEFFINPEINPNWNILVRGRLYLKRYPGSDTYCKIKIVKNGVVIFSTELEPSVFSAYIPYSVGYISGDVIAFQYEDRGSYPSMHSGSGAIFIDDIEFINGVGDISTVLSYFIQPIGPWV